MITFRALHCVFGINRFHTNANPWSEWKLVFLTVSLTSVANQLHYVWTYLQQKKKYLVCLIVNFRDRKVTGAFTTVLTWTGHHNRVLHYTPAVTVQIWFNSRIISLQRMRRLLLWQKSQLFVGWLEVPGLVSRSPAVVEREEDALY